MSLKLFIFIALFGFISATPKKYNPSEESGFLPSNHRYYETNLPNSSWNSTAGQKSAENKGFKDSGDKLRFGIPISTYGNTGAGVQYNSGGAGTSYMISPMKVDIGGIALGALIGLGAVLILPKLAGVLSGGYGYRSLETDMSSTLMNILARIDNSLEQHNIDSSSCVQRIICTYVTDAKKNLQAGEANTLDEFIYSFTNNTLFTYMLDGTAVKQAVELGKEGDIEKCSSLYSKCPITKENVLKVISSLLPA